jgi:hypothetical protein
MNLIKPGKKEFNLFKSLIIIKNLDSSVESWNYEKLDETNRISSYIKESISRINKIN